MEKQKALNTLAKGAGWTATGMVVSKFLTYFYRAAVARLLDPGAYGQLSMGLAVLSVVNTIAMLALGAALRKYIPEYLEKNDPAKVKGAVLSTFSTTLVLSLVASVALFLSAGFISREIFNAQNPEQFKILIQILAFVPPFGNLLDLTDAVIHGYQKVRYEVINERIFRNIVQLTATVAFIILGFKVAGAALGWLIGTALAMIVGLYIVERKLGPIMTSDVKPEFQFKKMLRFSAPMVFSGVVGTFLGHTDTIFLGYFLADSQVGIYNAALPTAALIMIPYEAFNTLALPSISELRESSEKDVPGVIKTLTRWTVSVSMPAFSVMALFSGQALHLLFGSEYMTASAALIVLAFGRLYSTATGHMGAVTKAYENTDLFFKNSLAKIVMNIGLNILLIPMLGIIGAAFATALTGVLMNTLLMGEIYYIHRIHPFSKDLLKPIISSGIGITAVYTGLHLIFETVPIWALVPGGAAFAIIYSVSLIGMKGFNEEDRRLILRIGRKLGEEEKARKLARLVIRK